MIFQTDSSFRESLASRCIVFILELGRFPWDELSREFSKDGKKSQTFERVRKTMVEMIIEEIGIDIDEQQSLSATSSEKVIKTADYISDIATCLCN